MTLNTKVKTSVLVLTCIILGAISTPSASAQIHSTSGGVVPVAINHIKVSKDVNLKAPNTTASTTGGGNKTFYLFTQEMEGINETKLGIPSDMYSQNLLVANLGDTVTIHFYNLDAGGRHTFTIKAPYNINEDVPSLQNATFKFIANHEGVYRFYCYYDQPTMAGQLVVLPPQDPKNDLG